MSVEGWVGLGATVVTGIGTLSLAVSTWHAVRDSRDERRERLVLDQRAQARLVSVELPIQAGTGEGVDDDHLNCTLKTRLTNNGPEPITQVVFLIGIEPSNVVLGDSVFAPALVKRIMPSSQPVEVTNYVQIRRVPPPRTIGSEVMPYEAWVEVEFTDGAGYRWRRTRDHRLEMISAPVSTAANKRRWFDLIKRPKSEATQERGSR